MSKLFGTLLAIALLIVLAFLGAAFLPRWWAQRVGNQVNAYRDGSPPPFCRSPRFVSLTKPVANNSSKPLRTSAAVTPQVSSCR